jgi:hypothetical protein
VHRSFPKGELDERWDVRLDEITIERLKTGAHQSRSVDEWKYSFRQILNEQKRIPKSMMTEYQNRAIWFLNPILCEISYEVDSVAFSTAITSTQYETFTFSMWNNTDDYRHFLIEENNLRHGERRTHCEVLSNRCTRKNLNETPLGAPCIVAPDAWRINGWSQNQF